MYDQQDCAGYRPGNMGRRLSRLYSSAPGGNQHVERAKQMPLRMKVLDGTHFPEAADFEPAAIESAATATFSTQPPVRAPAPRPALASPWLTSATSAIGAIIIHNNC